MVFEVLVLKPSNCYTPLVEQDLQALCSVWAWRRARACRHKLSVPRQK